MSRLAARLSVPYCTTMSSVLSLCTFASSSTLRLLPTRPDASDYQ